MTRSGGGCWAQTTYYPFLHASRYGRGTALKAIVQSPVYDCRDYESPSELIYSFYKAKAARNRINTRSADLRHLLSNAVERSAKKYDIQREQLADTEDREQYRIYGELINTYGYSAKKGDKSLTCVNYYDNQEITIPLDEQLTPSENSVRYFAKYNKKKRTYDFLSGMIEETKAELEYLRSVQTELRRADRPEIQVAKKDIREWFRDQSRSTSFHPTVTICMWAETTFRTMSCPSNLHQAMICGSMPRRCRDHM